MQAIALRHQGLRHIAIYVRNLAACVQFYCDYFAMRIEWQPDADNVYLTSGNDNLALHRIIAADADFTATRQYLDHIGFFVATPAAVDAWHQALLAHGVAIKTEPRTHRDGARSFYCYDPDERVIQIIYHPPISDSANVPDSMVLEA